MKERIFPEISHFGDPCSFFEYVKKEYETKPSPVIRFDLLLKLSDLEIVYPEEEKK